MVDIWRTDDTHIREIIADIKKVDEHLYDDPTAGRRQDLRATVWIHEETDQWYTFYTIPLSATKCGRCHSTYENSFSLVLWNHWIHDQNAVTSSSSERARPWTCFFTYRVTNRWIALSFREYVNTNTTWAHKTSGSLTLSLFSFSPSTIFYLDRTSTTLFQHRTFPIPVNTPSIVKQQQ